MSKILQRKGRFLLEDKYLNYPLVVKKFLKDFLILKASHSLVTSCTTYIACHENFEIIKFGDVPLDYSIREIRIKYISKGEE